MKQTTEELILEWQNIVEWTKISKAKTLEIEQELTKRKFPKPQIGKNTLRENGVVFTLTTALSASIDEATLKETLKLLPEGSEGYLVKWKPSLIAKGLKEMPEHLQKVFQQTLIVKPKKAVFKIENA